MSASSDDGWPRVEGETPVDVALLLEGTYPFVSGGVSSWVHEIVSGMPELSFAAIFLGSKPSAYGLPKYRRPKNLVHLETHYLMDDGASGHARPRRAESRTSWQGIRRLHDKFRDQGNGGGDGGAGDLVAAFREVGAVTPADLRGGEGGWQYIRDEYLRSSGSGGDGEDDGEGEGEARADGAAPPASLSFTDYYWTVRSMHRPLITLGEIARQAPPARVFHAISTGYAGLLGAMIRAERGSAFVLTEHGIYTKERRIDLARAEWIRDLATVEGGGLDPDVGPLRQLWISFFEGIGRLAYASADPIVTLFEANRLRQIRDGAPSDRTRVVPNGIELGRFVPGRRRGQTEAPPVLGLVGRVVPIKDIKTFIRAVRIVVNAIPEAEGWIVGPEEEDPAYARDCRALAKALGLEDRIRFLGFRAPEEILPQLGVVVLTSISEGLPLVVLEAFATGVPVVATDVGSCRELVEGSDSGDRALGAAGAVTPIGAPAETAAAALGLLRDPEAWRRASEAAIARVEGKYTREQMYAAYGDIYRTALGEGRRGPLHIVKSPERRPAPEDEEHGRDRV